METAPFWVSYAAGAAILAFIGYLLNKLVREIITLSREREDPSFESNWGGLGRGLGGWSVNRMTLFTFLALLLFAMFFTVTVLLLVGPFHQAGDDGPKKKTDSKAAESSSIGAATAPTPDQLGAPAADASHWNVEVVNCQLPESSLKPPARMTRRALSQCPAISGAPTISLPAGGNN